MRIIVQVQREYLARFKGFKKAVYGIFDNGLYFREETKRLSGIGAHNGVCFFLPVVWALFRRILEGPREDYQDEPGMQFIPDVESNMINGVQGSHEPWTAIGKRLIYHEEDIKREVEDLLIQSGKR